MNVDLFRAKYVLSPNGCWEWTACRNKEGRAVWAVNHGNGDIEVAHAARWAWRIYRGEIPKGMCVCHRCDNPGCVNPDHLWLGTHEENAADRHTKGRTSDSYRHSAAIQAKRPNRPVRLTRIREELPRGSEHHNAKLDEKKVRIIRSMMNEGRSFQSIAKAFGVSNPTIRNIRDGKIWRHVT